MPKIIINHKICDRSPECGGITVCPNQALTYDPQSKNIVWDKDKCVFCLQCTLPDACPIGAIMFAPNRQAEKTILNTINSDLRTEDWIWQERFGVQPGKPAVAKILDKSNFLAILKSSVPVLVDVWHEKFSDCRLHSVLYQDLFKDIDIPVYKLDAQINLELTGQLQTNKFPSLILIKNSQSHSVHTGFIEESDIPAVIDSIKKLLIN